MCDKRKVEILPDSDDFKIAADELRDAVVGDVRYYGRMAFGVPARTSRGTLVQFVQVNDEGCCASCFCVDASLGFHCPHIIAAYRKLSIAQGWQQAADEQAAAKKGVRR
jgi:hypothetical protein